MATEESTTGLLDIFEKTDKSDINDFIDDHAKSLPDVHILNKYILNKNETTADIFSRCAGYISKSYFYDIVSGVKSAPSRDIVLILCIASRLSLKETRKVLENYGHRPLYLKDTRDIIIATHINNDDYSIDTINDDLYAHKCVLLKNQ